jgi:hypothetical protein
MRLIAGLSIVKFRFRFPHQFPKFNHFGVSDTQWLIQLIG